MLAAKPDDRRALLEIGNYYAITGDSERALPYLEKAQAVKGVCHCPLYGAYGLCGVLAYGIADGCAHICLGVAGVFVGRHVVERGGLLETAGNNMPWLRRPLDMQLMRYAAYRRDPEAMERYAARMLAGMPHICLGVAGVFVGRHVVERGGAGPFAVGVGTPRFSHQGAVGSCRGGIGADSSQQG